MKGVLNWNVFWFPKGIPLWLISSYPNAITESRVGKRYIAVSWEPVVLSIALAKDPNLAFDQILQAIKTDIHKYTKAGQCIPLGSVCY